MRKHIVGVAVSVLIALSAAVAARAQTSEASNSTSWLDGFSLVWLESDDVSGLQRARAEIQTHGGRVAIMSPPSVILGWIPPDIRTELIGRAGIKDVFYTEILDGEIVAADAQTGYMIRYFNSVVRGDYQKKLFERIENASAAPKTWPDTGSDVRIPPDLEEAEYLKNLEAIGLDSDKLRDKGLLPQGAATAAGNSDAMTGTISVTLFFVESNGSIDPNLYTWSAQHVQDYVDGVNTGLAWWTQRAYNYFDCWNAFLVRYYPPTDGRCQQGYEPVTHDSGFASNWVSLVMGNFGYSSGSHFTRVDAYNTFQRATYGTDWAYSAFIAYNPPGAADRFTDGTSAYAWLLGPYTVLLYRSYGWDPDEVFTHETGHIFGACDEYAESDCSCTNCIGKLNQNCDLCSSGLCMMKLNTFTLCAWTPNQIGWSGNGCAPAPLPPPAPSGVNPPGGLQGVMTSITITGSDFVYGAEVDLGPNVTVMNTTFISPTTLTADIVPNTNAPVGPTDLMVLNRDLQSTTLPSAFEIQRTAYHYASLTGNAVFPYVTPADAALTIADAIKAAGEGDSVFVETGTYDEDDSLTVTKGFHLIGAWDNTFTARDLVSGKSMIDLQSTASHAIMIVSAAGPVVLDGFIVTNGEGSGQAFPVSADYGGAVYVRNSTVTIANCELSGNEAGSGGNFGAGGAIYAIGSTVDFHDNDLFGNSSGQGGAVFADSCTGAMTGNTISGNQLVFTSQAAHGGGIYLAKCTSLVLGDNTIAGNSAKTGVSGQNNGGGIYIKNSTGIAVLGGEIADNEAENSGGGVYYEVSDVTIDGALISHNTASLGGGIGSGFTPGSTMALANCAILWNTATGLGGGAFLTGAASVEYNIAVGNQAGTAGGFYMLSGTSGGFIGNTLDRNTAPNIGGVDLVSMDIPVFNNIIVNSGSVGLNCGGTTSIVPTYNNVWNSVGADYAGCTPGTGSISADPLFADTASTDYHLGLNSPAIDAGDPDPAYDDPDGSRGDLGLYGSHAFVMDQPVYPKNLAASLDAGDVLLAWTKNPEPDVEWYAVYKDTISDFVPSAANLLQLVTSGDSTYNAGVFVDTCYYRIAAVDTAGYASGNSNTAFVNPATGIGDVVSYGLELHQNHPNPFNPTTVISYELDRRLDVHMDIYDVQGRLVRRLVDAVREPGLYSIEWDGKNASGRSVSSGIYFYRLQAGGAVQTRKMVLLK